MYLNLYEQSVLLKTSMFAFQCDDTYNISVSEALMKFLSMYMCVWL